MAGGALQGPSYGEASDDFSSYRPMAEINVTPLVDVMLVLLIIFMVAAPLMMVGVPLDLPKTDAARVEKTREPVVVSIDSSGKFFIGESEVAEADLIARLFEMRQGDKEAPIYVRGDKAIDYGTVISLLGKIGQAGFPKVSLIAEAGEATKGLAPAPGLGPRRGGEGRPERNSERGRHGGPGVGGAP
ncbi:MAG TPA: ExbD/TolR family protein [Alphaproteobacteria bacterium]|nr:ExbD/TolR family protein [Alphaproteobacteria bacterium]